ncbi:MAG: hypothetical protein EBT15_04285 [Betaproteobacteria bacterium]|nr:hypothetical protein [Betaproteobacteria bacterium]
MDYDDIDDIDDTDFDDMDPEQLKEFFGGAQSYVLYGGPYDGQKNFSNHFIPAQPVIVRSATENGFVVQSTPNNLGEEVDPALNPDNMLGAVLDRFTLTPGKI